MLADEIGVKGVRLTRAHASAMMAMRQLSSTMLSENLRGAQILSGYTVEACTGFQSFALSVRSCMT